MLDKICAVVLTHQAPDHVEKMLAYWQDLFPGLDVVLVYGGSENDFAKIDHTKKVFVDDARLRTRDHQREFQTYSQVFERVSRSIEEDDYQYVYFTEYDQIPLRKDMFDLLLRRLHEESADMLCHRLTRIDGTSHPHYLYHQANSALTGHLRSVSVRSDTTVVLSALGFGQFWKREAFDSVAGHRSEVLCYLELWFPTLAHHLGFRIRGMGEQDVFNTFEGDFSDRIDALQKQGWWCVHPVKSLWASAG